MLSTLFTELTGCYCKFYSSYPNVKILASDYAFCSCFFHFFEILTYTLPRIVTLFLISLKIIHVVNGVIFALLSIKWYNEVQIP